MPDSRVRRYAITSFDDTPPIFNGDSVAFLVYEKETCPTTGTVHWQCYAEYHNKVSVQQALIKLDIKKGHAEAALGTAEQNITYCSKKKENVFLFGEPGRIGRRTDLDDIYEDIEDGLSTKQILRKYKGKALRYVNMISRARSILNGTDERENISDMKEQATAIMSSVLSFPEGTTREQLYNGHFTIEDGSDATSGFANTDDIAQEMNALSDHRSYKPS